jgi:hypothetical protein
MTTPTTKRGILRRLQREADAVNAIIHRSNLFIIKPEGRERVINCTVGQDNAGNCFLVVEGLYTAAKYQIAGNTFTNGRGESVTFSH